MKGIELPTNFDELENDVDDDDDIVTDTEEEEVTIVTPTRRAVQHITELETDKEYNNIKDTEETVVVPHTKKTLQNTAEMDALRNISNDIRGKLDNVFVNDKHVDPDTPNQEFNVSVVMGGVTDSTDNILEPNEWSNIINASNVKEVLEDQFPQDTISDQNNDINVTSIKTNEEDIIMNILSSTPSNITDEIVINDSTHNQDVIISDTTDNDIDEVIDFLNTESSTFKVSTDTTDSTVNIETTLDEVIQSSRDDSIEFQDMSVATEQNDLSIETTDEVFTGYKPEKLTEDTATPLVISLQNKDENDEAILSYLPLDTDDDDTRNSKIDQLVNDHAYEYRTNHAYRYDITQQKEFLRQGLQHAVDNEHSFGKRAVLDGKKIGDATASKEPLKSLPSGTVVTGKNGFDLTMSLIGGYKKVYLYNSGFWVLIRSPLNDELNEYRMNCRSAEFEFGYVFGQLCYFPINNVIKREGVALFKKLIIKSNLHDWENKFDASLKEPDYDVCLWAMLSLMFKNGMDIEFLCHNGTCRNIDKQKLDPSQLRIVDYTLVNKDVLRFCSSSELKTQEMLDDFHKNILKDTATIRLSDEWSVNTSIPSMRKVIEDGDVYISELAAKVQTTSTEDCDSYLRARHYRVFAPYIERMTYTDVDTGKIIHFEDTSLAENIGALQLNRSLDLVKKVVDFMHNYKTSYIAYSYTKCPLCNNVPSAAIKGMIPCDVEQSFFILVVNYLKD